MNSTYSVLDTVLHSKRLLTEAFLLMVMTRIVEGVHTCKAACPGVDRPLHFVKPEARDEQAYTHNSCRT